MLRALAAGTVVLASVGAFVLWPRPSRITEANCERIREGMSRAEVYAILGGPPGDYRSVLTCGPELDEPFVTASILVGDPPRSEALKFERWQGDVGNIYVTFWPERVCAKSFVSAVRVEQGSIDTLLWWAERQWRRWFR
jgi:hypothetical protein